MRAERGTVFSVDPSKPGTTEIFSSCLVTCGTGRSVTILKTIEIVDVVVHPLLVLFDRFPSSA